MNAIRKSIMLIQQEFHVFHFRMQVAIVLLSVFPPYTAYRFRTWLFRLSGFSIGKGSAIMGTPRLVGPPDLYTKLIVGKNCYIGPDCYIDIGGNIVIRDNATIGPQTTIITGTHQIGPQSRRLGDTYYKDVEIGEGVWIGARCTILPGVKIGKGVVVAAGAVVTKDIPDNVLVGGVPAKIIRELCDE